MIRQNGLDVTDIAATRGLSDTQLARIKVARPDLPSSERFHETVESVSHSDEEISIERNNYVDQLMQEFGV